MSNYEQRLALRPEVPTTPTTQPEEAFQNETLRPVLKLQHDHLKAVTDSFLLKRKVKIDQVAKVKRREKIKELIARDNRLRGLLFGIIIGQFVAEELAYYLANESATNRRITNLLQERLLSVYG